MRVSSNFWGVQGWEVTASGNFAACFTALPPSSTTIHHVIFANNIANGCQANGINSYNNGGAAVDYIVVVGSIAYNAAQGNQFCYSGISIAAPVNSDTVAGTHIYVAGNFAYANVDPNPCQGVTPTDGEGINMDTIDGSSTGHPYTGQIVVDNNISVGNARGYELFKNENGTPATVYFRQNTSWGNGVGALNNNCAEYFTNSADRFTMFGNIGVANNANACGGGLAHVVYDVNGNGSASLVENTDGFSATGANIYTAQFNAGWAGFGPGNISTNPVLSAPAVPGAPSCGAFADVPHCMATMIANFTPTTAAAKAYGYQIPSTSPISDPLFPQWLCNVNLPAGLVTMGCASSSSLPAPPTNINAVVK